MSARYLALALLAASAFASSPSPVVSPHIETPYRAFPFYFERNGGQFAANVRYAARGAGYTLNFADRAVNITLGAPGGERHLSMRFSGAADSSPVGERLLPGTANYFIGPEPANWHVGVPTFAHIRYAQLWPGVDAVFYGNAGRLEYDLVVAPGADPTRARIAFDGADSITVTPSGELTLGTGTDTVRYSKPLAYQIVDGRRTEVPAEYVLSGNEISFEAGPYDTRQPLVIDPVLHYSTPVNGAVMSVEVDPTGSTYAAINGKDGSGTDTDTCVTKLSVDGSTMLYYTCIGSPGFDAVVSLALDGNGSAYLLGFTDSAGGQVPTTPGAFRTVRGAAYDGYLVKLSAAGSIVYSTYLAGNSDDFGPALGDVEVDGSGAAYVTGLTLSTDFPTTANAYRRSMSGISEGIALKLNPAGSALVYSTFLGDLLPQALELDVSNQAVIAGTSAAFTPAIATPAGWGGDYDAVLLKLNASGSTLVFSRLFGGSAIDTAEDLTIAPDGTLLIAGDTSSTDLPGINDGIPEQYMAGEKDAYLAAFTANGRTLQYAAYIGGSASDQASAVVANAGEVYVFGTTSSGDMALYVEPWETVDDPTFNGPTDGFIAEFTFGNPNHVSFFGGTGNDSINDVALDGAGRFNIGGTTAAADFPKRRPIAGQTGPGFLTRMGEVAQGTVTPFQYIVHVADVAELFGNWQVVDDPTAAGGRRVFNPDAGLPKLAAPLANPVDYIEIDLPPALRYGPYRVWFRGKAQNNSYSNDSFWVQWEFSDDDYPDDDHNPIYRIGTTDAMTVVLEDCSGCNLRGWGWQDSGYGRHVVGRSVFFGYGTPGRMRIQRREDGVSIDQIVFSQGGPYFWSPPGYQKDDTLILPASTLGGGESSDVVVYAGVDSPQLHGNWTVVDDPTAAGGRRLAHPDQGAPKLAAPLAAPTHFVELLVEVEAGVPYYLHVRGKAARDDPYNDSVFVQFSDNETYGIGTTNAIAVNLETCSSAGLQGWGWRSGGWCESAGTPTRVVWSSSGVHTIRIQTREDGVSIDQIVLSPERFATEAPGAAKNDMTIVER